MQVNTNENEIVIIIEAAAGDSVEDGILLPPCTQASTHTNTTKEPTLVYRPRGAF